MTKPKLGRKKGHREHLLVNLATALILHEKIVTTQAKAKALKPFIERLIAKARHKNLASRRYLLSRLDHHQLAVKKLIEDIAERYKNQSSGFVSTVKIGQRLGDNAPQVQISLTKKIEDVIDKKNESESKGNENSQKRSS